MKRMPLRTALLSLLAAAALPAFAQPPRLNLPKPDAPAKLIQGSCAVAEYPKAAEQAGQEGTVSVVLTVSDQGTVRDASVARSSQSAALDTESRYIGSKCRFTPALKDGKPVFSQVTLPFVWKLTDPPAAAASAASGAERAASAAP